MALSNLLIGPLDFDQVPGWKKDDHNAALNAFYKVARNTLAKPYPARSLGVSGAALAEIGSWLFKLDEGVLGREARWFFEDHFIPYYVMPGEDTAPSKRGFVTGYYEPELLGSRHKSSQFFAPLHRRPDDLVEVSALDAADIPKDWDPAMRFARQTGGTIIPYYDRAAICSGALDHQNLEIVFLDNPIDAFFVHIQGSARIRLVEGGTLRVGYAGKTGHAYSAIGRDLIERGAINRRDMSMNAIRSWLQAHPHEQNEVMWKNRSYIFFKEIVGLNDSDGPVGAANVSLTRGRSLAVDRLIHTFGTPIFLDADIDGEFQRLMIAQDTGSAMIGPARGDIFFGSGVEAEMRAGAIQHSADFYVLWPRNQASDRLP